MLYKHIKHKFFTETTALQSTVSHYTYQKRSFTLAEVLITLAVIGVVAAMSIPGLMSNTNKAELVNKLLKASATLSQATQMIKTENGGTLAGAFVGSSAEEMSNDMRDKYKSKMVGVKECSSEVNNDCWHKDNEFYNLNGDPWPINYLNDYGDLVSGEGFLYSFLNHDNDCKGDYGQNQFKQICGWVTVDVNGFKKPNTVGIDIFRFWITQQGVYAFGSPGDSRPESSYCNKSSTSQNYNGNACTAVVIRTKAMDYLKN